MYPTTLKHDPNPYVLGIYPQYTFLAICLPDNLLYFAKLYSSTSFSFERSVVHGPPYRARLSRLQTLTSSCCQRAGAVSVSRSSTVQITGRASFVDNHGGAYGGKRRVGIHVS